MNIGKMYDNYAKARRAMEGFVEMNGCYVNQANLQGMRVEMVNGTVLYFLDVHPDSYHRIAGYQFSFVDLDINSRFTEGALNFIKSRIRDRNMFK